jgi:hypothetical protein
MYLFSRQVRLGGGQTRKAMEWALAQTEKVKQITGLDVGLFTQVFSPEVGVIGWSTFVPDLATLETAGDKLNVDEAMVAATDSGASFVDGGASDRLLQVVHGAPDPNRQVEYVTSVTAMCAAGHMSRAMELGVEIAVRAEKITGTPTMFVRDVTGNYAGVGWLTGHENVQAMEAAEQALAADTSWPKFIDKETAGVFAENTSPTTSTIYRRLA